MLCRQAPSDKRMPLGHGQRRKTSSFEQFLIIFSDFARRLEFSEADFGGKFKTADHAYENLALNPKFDLSLAPR